MKPNRFRYHAPAEVAEVLDLLSDLGDEAKVLAGGQSLLPLLSFRLAAPEVIIDINRLPGVESPGRTGTGWRIPSLVRQRTVERSADIAATVPLLRQALVQVAHPQVRNRGTVCGSLAHSDAAAELPAVMLALDARMTVASASGQRVLTAEDFFVFHLTSALQDDELLLHVDVDNLPAETYTSFQEYATRHGDFGIAGVAVVVTFEGGAVADCRVTAAGVAPTPVRLEAVEAVVLGSSLTPEVVAEAEDAASRAVSPTGDVHADAAYRRRLVGVLTKRALQDVVVAKEGRHAAA
jgi:carbon-monoxide dehydrogenase medium subunit